MTSLRFRYRLSGWQQESFPIFAKRGEVRADSVVLDRREIPLANIGETANLGNELVISVTTPYVRDIVQISVASGRLGRAVRASGAVNARGVREAIDGTRSRARFRSNFPPSLDLACRSLACLGRLEEAKAMAARYRAPTEPAARDTTRAGDKGDVDFVGTV